MTKFIFTEKAKEEFQNLEHLAQIKISTKLEHLKDYNISPILREIHGITAVTHRMKIGRFRLLLIIPKKEPPENANYLIVKIDTFLKIYR